MSESRSESVRRRNIERLIELIYETPAGERRRTLVAQLAEQEAEAAKTQPRKRLC